MDRLACRMKVEFGRRKPNYEFIDTLGSQYGDNDAGHRFDHAVDSLDGNGCQKCHPEQAAMRSAFVGLDHHGGLTIGCSGVDRISGTIVVGSRNRSKTVVRDCTDTFQYRRLHWLGNAHGFVPCPLAAFPVPEYQTLLDADAQVGGLAPYGASNAAAVWGLTSSGGPGALDRNLPTLYLNDVWKVHANDELANRARSV